MNFIVCWCTEESVFGRHTAKLSDWMFRFGSTRRSMIAGRQCITKISNKTKKFLENKWTVSCEFSVKFSAKWSPVYFHYVNSFRSAKSGIHHFPNWISRILPISERERANSLSPVLKGILSNYSSSYFTVITGWSRNSPGLLSDAPAL